MHHCRIVSLCLIALVSSEATFAEDPVSFAQDVRPILSDHCFACHGPDAETREADLRLDSLESATANKAVVPGDIQASELWSRITSDDHDSVMPPPEFGKPITKEQRATLKKWIESGAEYTTHWSFTAPVRPPVPVGNRQTTHPINAFLQEQLHSVELTPSPLADRRTLIRRVTLDLTGLPPTPDEIQAFINDESNNAYETLIDRLFSRTTYGEHMS